VSGSTDGIGNLTSEDSRYENVTGEVKTLEWGLYAETAHNETVIQGSPSGPRFELAVEAPDDGQVRGYQEVWDGDAAYVLSVEASIGNMSRMNVTVTARASATGSETFSFVAKNCSNPAQTSTLFTVSGGYAWYNGTVDTDFVCSDGELWLRWFSNVADAAQNSLYLDFLEGKTWNYALWLEADVRHSYRDIAMGRSDVVEIYVTARDFGEQDLEVSVWDYDTGTWDVLGMAFPNATAERRRASIAAERHVSGGEMVVRFFGNTSSSESYLLDHELARVRMEPGGLDWIVILLVIAVLMLILPLIARQFG
jgi:hypothetical protein